jgi:hypothetical protein
MRILIVDTYYPAFLASHYEANPGLAQGSYEEQWRSLMGRFFGTGDAYSHYLAPIGHEAHEVVANAAPLQRAWAKEHGQRMSLVDRIRHRPSASLLLAQAEWFRPDVVYVQDMGFLRRETAVALKARSRLLVGQIASEPPDESLLREYDLVLTSFPHFVSRFRALGLASEYFKIGFDPRVLDALGGVEPCYGAVFVGALGRLQHARGNVLLERASELTSIEFWGYSDVPSEPPSSLVPRYHGEAWGLDMFRILAKARIALNRHIDVAENYANNMRLFEGTGVGALLLTDAKQNLGELFDVGREVLAYHDERELADAVEHYLAHDDERAAIAAAGQKRTLEVHTYSVRMEELAAILEAYLR